MLLTKEQVQADIDALPENYKTKDVDALIKRYVKEGADVSLLRAHILGEQQLHRIYFHTSLKQIKDPGERLAFIDENLLFSDWWHTDQLINLVSRAEFDTAFGYAQRYVFNDDPFVRRWGYVMFISRLCKSRDNLERIISLLHNDGEYYVQMAQAWLIAELAIFFPEEIFRYMKNGCALRYNITGKAIQKICDSYRITDEDKDRFRSLREPLKLIK